MENYVLSFKMCNEIHNFRGLIDPINIMYKLEIRFIQLFIVNRWLYDFPAVKWILKDDPSLYQAHFHFCSSIINKQLTTINSLGMPQKDYIFRRAHHVY